MLKVIIAETKLWPFQTLMAQETPESLHTYGQGKGHTKVSVVKETKALVQGEFRKAMTWYLLKEVQITHV